MHTYLLIVFTGYRAARVGAVTVAADDMMSRVLNGGATAMRNYVDLLASCNCDCFCAEDRYNVVLSVILELLNPSRRYRLWIVRVYNIIADGGG